jgi:uncharacterized membrane protein YfcA
MVLMASAAVVGSYIGARFTGKVTLDRLIKVVGAVLLVIGAMLLWRALF